MIKILNAENINSEAWMELCNRSSTTTFFQTKTCYDFFCSLSFMKSFVYGVEENGQLKGLVSGYVVANGGLLTSNFSRRAIIHGGLLLDDNISNESLSALLNFLKNNLYKKVIYIEIRNFVDYSEYKKILEINGFIYQPHLNLHVHTNKSTDILFKKLKEEKQRQIKQAKKNGLTSVETEDINDINDFYTLLKKLYKNIHLPIFPLEFFEKIVKHKDAHLIVIKRENKTVGGILLVTDSKKVYEWFIVGDNKKPENKYSSVLATWEGIRFAAENGFETFDFMGAGKPEKEYGVRNFKKKFGTIELETGRYLFVCKNFKYSIGKLFFERIIKNK